jgi:hypothetical protein
LIGQRLGLVLGARDGLTGHAALDCQL